MSKLFNESTEVTSKLSPLEKIADSVLSDKTLTSPELNVSIAKMEDKNPYASGFDKDHPMPTYDQLRNAGFSDYLANQILFGTHSYSDKELFKVLYSSNPVKAYNLMMEAKVKKFK